MDDCLADYSAATTVVRWVAYWVVLTAEVLVESTDYRLVDKKVYPMAGSLDESKDA